MAWLIIAIIAQIILGTSAVFDKFLLKRTRIKPVAYTFFLGLIGGLAFVLIPFGGLTIGYFSMLTALYSGVFFIFGMMALFYALSKGNASSLLPLMGGLSVIFTFVFSDLLLQEKLYGADLIGLGILLLGAILFFLVEKKHTQSFIFLSILASAIFLALSNVVAKQVFDHTSFVAGFMWIKIGGVVGVLALVAIPICRRKIFAAHRDVGMRHKTWYTANRIYAGVGSILISAAIFLAHPALVDATQGLKFAVIFIAGIFLLHEHLSYRRTIIGLCATMIVFVGIAWLGAVHYARSIPYDQNRKITWGVTFSKKYSTALKVDWKENFSAIIDQLHPKKIRLISYWDETEPTPQQYDFSSLDWQIDRAAASGAEIILVMGMRVPRWPECFLPAWVSELPQQDRERAVQEYITAIIKHYRERKEIAVWQVENEPYLSFGHCGSRPAGFLDQEVTLVHRLDSSRRVLITDGGELGRWYWAAKVGDIFGTTMYREFYSPKYGKYTGVVQYPLAPSFFRLKQKVIRFLLHDYIKHFVVIELQGEPWGRVEIPVLPLEEQLAIFSLSYFKDTIEYAKETGFDEYYLWGAEWWYQMGVKNNNWEYWNEAQKLMHEK